LTVGSVISTNATYSNDITNVNWTVDEYKSPQLIAKIELINAMNTVVKTEQYTLPEKRSAAINHHLDNGIYVVKITLTDIFNQTSIPAMYNLTVNNILSIDENNLSDRLIKIVPNPANDFITITGNSLQQALLFDALGKEIITTSITTPTTTIDVSSLTKGIYFIVVKDKNNTTHKEKIIIE
jgi:hypothetical protein